MDKIELEKIVREIEWKLEALPEKYFIDYVETELIKKLKKLII